MRKIYFYLIATALLAVSTGLKAEDVKTFYAAVCSDIMGNIEPNGIISLKSSDLYNYQEEVNKVVSMDDLVDAAAMAEGKYYAMCKDDMMETSTKFRTIDFETGQTADLGDATALYDMTYDTSSKTMYGINNNDDGSRLYSINLANGKVTEIAKWDGIWFIGIAADGKGNLYVMADDNKLYSINLGNKQYTETIALQGDLMPYGYGHQSVEFEGNTLYWLGNNADGDAFLATINMSDGTVTNKGEGFLKTKYGYVTLTGLCFSMATGGGGTDPEPESDYTKVSIVETWGDIMGTTDTITKREIYFYDTDNNILRRIQEGTATLTEGGKEFTWIPMSYWTYTYNDQKQLTEMFYRQYGKYDGDDMAWSDDIKGKETYKYNENGKLIEKTDESRHYVYEWEGNNIVKDTMFSAFSGDMISCAEYSDFLEGVANCPQKVVSNGAYESNIFTATYTYDNNHNKLTYIVLNSKGENKSKEEWKYNDAGQLIENTTYKVKNKEYVPVSKTVYTIDGNKTKAQTLEYSEYINADGEEIKEWSTKPTYTVTITSEFYGTTAPGNLEVTKVDGKTNTVQLAFDAPDRLSIEDPAYDIYRQGTKIGRATLDQAKGKYVYTDELVWNGTYDYFVQTVNNEEETERYNISNVVTYDIYTELPPVTNVHYVSHEIVDKNYQVTIGWDAPVTDLYIVSYNIFRGKDHKSPDVKVTEGTPLPTSAIVDFGGAEYTTSEKYDIIVETVYNIGKIKADPVEIDLANYVSINNNNLKDLIQVEGNMIFVNGEVSVEIIGTNGMIINRYANVPMIDTTALPQGIYILKVDCNREVYTMKMVKR